jgi:tRNA U34 5-carboxymethylaminomethyl modifying GTPase MnmE/TrmE
VAEELPKRTRELAGLFQAEFLPVSSKTGHGLAELLDALAKSIAAGAGGHGPPSGLPAADGASFPALTARHRQAVTEAMESVRQATAQVKRGSEEVAVMMIRSACQSIAQIEHQAIDEQVLDRIFSRFCIGK